VSFGRSAADASSGLAGKLADPGGDQREQKKFGEISVTTAALTTT
jgi:hypothetical protein